MSSEYGTYRLTYTPPNDPDPHYPLISIDMSTSGDADVSQMLRFFESFLAASGYVLKGELQVVERDPRPDYNLWNMTTQGSQATDFMPFSSYDFGDDGFPPMGDLVYGATGTDTIHFG